MALIVFLNMSCCLWWPDFSNSCWLRNHPNGEGGGNATHTNHTTHTTHQHPLISAHVWVCAGRKQLVDTFTVQWTLSCGGKNKKKNNVEDDVSRRQSLAVFFLLFIYLYKYQSATHFHSTQKWWTYESRTFATHINIFNGNGVGGIKAKHEHCWH